MKKTIVFLAFLSLLFHSCDDKGNILCTSPPPSFTFEFVDSKTGVNVFTNGTYLPSQVKVTNAKDNSIVKFDFLADNRGNLIRIGEIGFKTQKLTLNISLADKLLYTFYVDAESKSNDGCSFTDIKEVKITGANYKLNTENGIYTISVD